MLLISHDVALPLGHDHVKGRLVVLLDVNAGRRHFSVDDLGEDGDVAGCVRLHSLHEVQSSQVTIFLRRGVKYLKYSLRSSNSISIEFFYLLAICC